MCVHAVHVAPLVERWPHMSAPLPAVQWPGLIWRDPQGPSVAAATPPEWPGWGHQGECGPLSGVLACLSPSVDRTGVMTNPELHGHFFRPFAMGTCTKSRATSEDR